MELLKPSPKVRSSKKSRASKATALLAVISQPNWAKNAFRLNERISNIIRHRKKRDFRAFSLFLSGEELLRLVFYQPG